MWIARATVLANQQLTGPRRDTQASRAKAAEAAARKRKAKREGAPHTDGNESPVTDTPQSTDHTNGHTLQATDVGWWCSTCTLKSSCKRNITAKKCRGPAIINWKAKAKQRPTPTGSNRKHCMVRNGTLHWCVTCGSYAETAPKLLAQACRGKHQGRWKAGGSKGQLKTLLSGLHPKTRLPIPPPVFILADGSDGGYYLADVVSSKPPERKAGPVAHSIVDDGSEFTRAFLKRLNDEQAHVGNPKSNVLQGISKRLKAARTKVPQLWQPTRRIHGKSAPPCVTATTNSSKPQPAQSITTANPPAEALLAH